MLSLGDELCGGFFYEVAFFNLVLSVGLGCGIIWLNLSVIRLSEHLFELSERLFGHTPPEHVQ